jgi:flagella basal body P-ring formation protein FlgA
MQTHNAAFLAAIMCVVNSARAQSANRGSVRIPVASHDLTRGTVLSASDFHWSDTTLTDGSTPDAAPVSAGWVTRRVIHAGEILREPGVAKPDVISAGDAVDVVYWTPGVSIRLRGTAIGRGRIGDEVYVKLDNRRRLHGVISGPNTVRVM